MATAVAISGCSTDVATPMTTPANRTTAVEIGGSTTAPTTIAAPTTERPTTGAPATAPSTTGAAAPASTPTLAASEASDPADPVQTAQREVAERYGAFSVAGNECVAAADACDLPTVFDEFAIPEAALYQLYENRWFDRIQNDTRSTKLDRIRRSVASVQVDGDIATLTTCVADGSVVVDSAGVVVDDGVGYRREETLWQLEATTWRLVGGTTFRLDPVGDDVCSF